jgi:hypothetical protein
LSPRRFALPGRLTWYAASSKPASTGKTAPECDRKLLAVALGRKSMRQKEKNDPAKKKYLVSGTR